MPKGLGSIGGGAVQITPDTRDDKLIQLDDLRSVVHLAIVNNLEMFLDYKLRGPMRNSLAKELEKQLPGQLDSSLARYLDQRLSQTIQEHLGPHLESQRSQLGQQLGQGVADIAKLLTIAIGEALSSWMADNFQTEMRMPLRNIIADELARQLVGVLGGALESRLPPLLDRLLAKHLVEWAQIQNDKFDRRTEMLMQKVMAGLAAIPQPLPPQPTFFGWLLGKIRKLRRNG